MTVKKWKSCFKSGFPKMAHNYLIHDIKLRKYNIVRWRKGNVTDRKEDSRFESCPDYKQQQERHHESLLPKHSRLV